MIIILSGFGIKEKEATVSKERNYINNTSKSEVPNKISVTTLPPFKANKVNNIKIVLAERLKIPEGKISLISYKRIVWEDSSLGCPQPGHLYSQTIVPGVKITLEANGKEYNYHANTSYIFFYCSN